MVLSIAGIPVKFEGELGDGFLEAFETLFARRYLPDVERCDCEPQVIVDRFVGDEFRVFSAIYDHGGVDEYKVESPLPVAYGNEAPVFFLLQAISRAGAKRGKIFLTDSVGVLKPDGKAVLFVGYPHTGKSTISALALSEGYKVLSTENTVVEVRDSAIYVTGGTDVLVYDPRIEEIYGVKVDYDAETKSGYRIKDIRTDVERRKMLNKGVEVEKIIVTHAGFNCSGASFSPVRGRKVKKSLWYFATALIKGIDFYTPTPLHMPMNDEITASIESFLEVAASKYSHRMFEAFGDHRSIFEAVIKL